MLAIYTGSRNKMSKPSVATNKVPPQLLCEAEYEAWKKDIEIWCLLTDLEKKKQALAIHLGLTGRARMVSSEISVADLSKDDGVETLIDKLDALFLLDKGRRQFNAYQKLYNLRRKSSVSIAEFIVEFEHEYHSFTKQGLTLPDTVIAFMLLASCSLEDKEIQVVMSGLPDVDYKHMKSALKRIYGGICGSDQAAVQVKSEPTFECYDEEENNSAAFFVRGRGRRGGNYRAVSTRTAGGRQPRRRENPVDKKTGAVSRCVICGSKFHWASKCPDAFENAGYSHFTDDAATENNEEAEEEEVYLSLFIGYAGEEKMTSDSKLEKLVKEASGAALIDSGCSRTVCGKSWMKDYTESLSDYDRSCIKEQNSNVSFTFGDGNSEKSIKKVKIPCYIGGKRCTIETDVVNCNIPLLLSKPAMKKAKMSLNFENDTALFGDLTISLRCSFSGHYLLPINM